MQPLWQGVCHFYLHFKLLECSVWPHLQAGAAYRTSLKEQWLIQALEQLQQDPPAVLEAVSCALQQLVQVRSGFLDFLRCVPLRSCIG